MSVTRVAACSVRGCPAPRSPEWHVPWCGHGLAGEHQHWPKRSQGGKNIVAFLCHDCHAMIDSGPWGNKVQDIPGKGLMYWAWDLHGKVLFERVIGEGDGRLHGPADSPSGSAGGGHRAGVPAPVATASEADEQESPLHQPAGEDVADYRPSLSVSPGVAAEAHSPLSTARGNASTAAAPFLTSWCQRGMVLVYQERRLESGIHAVEAAIDDWRFQVGDWLNEGEGMMPEEVHGYLRGFHSEMTLRQYAWVAAKVVTRVEELDWVHHRAVAALPPSEQEQMLSKAKEEGLSSRALSALVRGDTAPVKRWTTEDLRERLHLDFLAYYQASDTEQELELPIEMVSLAVEAFIDWLSELRR